MTRLITVCRAAQLTPAAYQFYCAILRTFPARGEPPLPPEVSHLAQQFAVPLAATLADMAVQDLIQLDAVTGHILAAYPFSGVPTVHRVTLAPSLAEGRHGLESQQVFAMCALDALGIPLMLRREASIVSQDALTHQQVRVLIAPLSAASPDTFAGWNAQWDPPSAVVFARVAEHEHNSGCAAAGTCCPITNFFADSATAQEWAQAHTVPDGVVLGQDEALHRAQALFGGVLHRVDSDEDQQP